MNSNISLTKLVHPDIANKAAEIVMNGMIKISAHYPEFNQAPLPEIYWFDNKNGKAARFAGFIRPGFHRIYLNINYIREQSFWDNTILHELAHIITHRKFPCAKQAHGPEFRFVCRLLGIKENTYHSMAPEGVDLQRVRRRNSNYVGVCSCGAIHKNISSRIVNAMLAGQKRRCNICKTTVVLRAISEANSP
jgi:predicted SprT family Zn-dependent metalloprotease